MSHHQVLLADIVGKTIHDWFVPADGKAITILLKEGRISLGAPVVRSTSSIDAGADQLVTITALEYPEPKADDQVHTLTLMTANGALVIEYEGALYLTELPE